jgi:hypothetical protein
MKIRLLILELLATIFGLICAGAAIASVYFLYGAFTKVAPWFYVLWSLGAGLFAMLIAAALNGSKKRIDYVDQLIERGYAQAEAEAAWRIAKNGGMDLLTNLHQVELADEIDRLESDLGIPNAEENGA